MMTSFVLALALAGAAGVSVPAGSRTFEVTYAACVPRVEGAEPVRLWMPVPHTGPEQTVSAPVVTCPAPHRIVRDARGNTMLFAELPAATTPVTVTWRCTVTRIESRSGHLPLAPEERADPRRFLREQRLGVVSHPDVKRALARARKVRSASGGVPRMIYDHVLAEMEYDKTAPGWGQGDTLRACQVGKGNCTDFHALFISMCRASKVPAEFAVGLPLPPSKGTGPIAGYHCWAYYVSTRNGWMPVDVSEARKAPARKDYFFGTLTADRVELSRGRDLVLEPPQSGTPVNFFVEPHAEQAGLRVPVRREAAFRDL